MGEKSPLTTGAKREMNRLTGAIAFISTTECGVIKNGGYMHILKEELVVRGCKIGHHKSQRASWITDNQNRIRILIYF